GDGMLPLAGTSATADPDSRDSTVQLALGFPSFDPLRFDLYRRTSERSMDNPFYCQQTLFEAASAPRFRETASRGAPIRATVAAPRPGNEPDPVSRLRPFKR